MGSNNDRTATPKVEADITVDIRRKSRRQEDHWDDFLPCTWISCLPGLSPTPRRDPLLESTGARRTHVTVRAENQQQRCQARETSEWLTPSPEFFRQTHLAESDERSTFARLVGPVEGHRTHKQEEDSRSLDMIPEMKSRRRTYRCIGCIQHTHGMIPVRGDKANIHGRHTSVSLPVLQHSHLARAHLLRASHTHPFPFASELFTPASHTEAMQLLRKSAPWCHRRRRISLRFLAVWLCRPPCPCRLRSRHQDTRKVFTSFLFFFILLVLLLILCTLRLHITWFNLGCCTICKSLLRFL